MRDQQPGTPPSLPPDLSHSDDVFGSSIQARPNGAQEDSIDIWGRRIGRGLAVIVAIIIIAMFLWPQMSGS